MRRSVHSVCAVLLVAVGLGSDSPKEYDDGTEVAGVEGTWRLTEITNYGRKEKPDTPMVVTFHHGIYAYNSSSGESWEGT